MPTSLQKFIFICLLTLGSSLVIADTSPPPLYKDFYSQDGTKAKGGTDSGYQEEIDVFSGGIRVGIPLVNTPGPGEVSMNFMWSYNSMEPDAGGIHPPRLRTAIGDFVCPLTVNPAKVVTLQMPDASTWRFYVDAVGANTAHSSNNWAVACNQDGTATMKSPDGIAWTMAVNAQVEHDYLSATGPNGFHGSTSNPADGSVQNQGGKFNYLLPTQQTDRYGNNVQYQYFGALLWMAAATDGRFVMFGWNHGLPTAVSAESGHIWNFIYSGNNFTLTQPDGQVWSVEQALGWDNVMTGGTLPGGEPLVTAVTNPHGGSTQYQYSAYQVLNPAVVCATNPGCATLLQPWLRETPHPVIWRKSTTNSSGLPAQWTYKAFVDNSTSLPPEVNAPAAFSNSHTLRTVDITGITQPYTVSYQFYSPYEFTQQDCQNNAWKIGLLLEKDTSVTGQSPKQQETYGWVSQPFASGTTVGLMGTGACLGLVQRALLQDSTITRDGVAYKTHTLYDAYGHPATITENGDAKTRVTHRTWLNDTINWILDRPTQETIGDGATTLSTSNYSYFPQGTLSSSQQDGVTTAFTYDTSGNLSSSKDARGLITTYANYYRGVARAESRPFASGTEPAWCAAPRATVTINRTVDDNGNVLTYTDARGKLYTYHYDPMNRLTYEQRPAGNPVNISWTATTRTIQRDGYSKTDNFDGFGRPLATIENGVWVSRTYDALGRLTYQSYPGVGIGIGDSFSYDELNRVTAVVHSDQSSQVTGYKGSAEASTDENRQITSRYYQAYGNPDEKALIGVYPNVVNASTIISRNVLGNVTAVQQGSASRSWGYDSHNFLVSRTDPETGVSTLGRDAAGNLISKRVGSMPAATYTWDGQGRMSSISYSDGVAEQVCKVRDAAGNVISLVSPSVTRNYQYDDNENLHIEKLTAAGNVLALQHDYDADDRLSVDTYPDGTQVAYNPDNFGRPTSIGSYASSVNYNARGNVWTWTAGNNEHTDNAYEARGWLKETQVAPLGVTLPVSPVKPVAPPAVGAEPQVPLPTPGPQPPAPVAPGAQPVAPTPPPPAPVAPNPPGSADPAAGQNGATACPKAYRAPIAADYSSGGGAGQLQADTATYNTLIATCTASWDQHQSYWSNGDAGCRETSPEPKPSDYLNSTHPGQYTDAHAAWQGRMNTCVPQWQNNAAPWVTYFAALASYQVNAPIASHQHDVYNAQVVAYQQQQVSWQSSQNQYISAQQAVAVWQSTSNAYAPKLVAYQAAHDAWVAASTAQSSYNAQLVTYNAQLVAYQQALATAQPVMDMQVSHDYAGNPLGIADPFSPNLTRTFAYDPLNRLIQADGPWGSGTSIKYDGNGNLLSQTLGGYAVTYGYDTQQRLVSLAGTKNYTLSYDGWGNVTSRGGGTSWTYDAAGNLRWSNKGTPSQIAYTYDGDGTRVMSVGNGDNSLEFYDSGNQLRYEKNLQSGAIKTYFYLAGQKIADNDGSNKVWYHNDAVGSPVAATDVNHAILWRNFYHPYGERMSGAGGVVNKQWFGGKSYEDATGLSYFGARWYDPVVGRFMAMDPVDWNSGNPSHSFNAYMYANNNPYRFTDPDGRCPVCEGIVIVGAGVWIGTHPDIGRDFLNGIKSMMQTSTSVQATTGTIATSDSQDQQRTATYHRLESPTQTVQDAAMQEASQMMAGKEAQGSSTPSVKAYPGALPAGKRGIEFTTSLPPMQGQRAQIVQWYEGQPGVIPFKDGMVAIPVHVTKNTQTPEATSTKSSGESQ